MIFSILPFSFPFNSPANNFHITRPNNSKLNQFHTSWNNINKKISSKLVTYNSRIVYLLMQVTLKENVLLVTNFSDQKLLVTIITNLIQVYKVKKSLVTKIVTIMNKKL